MTIPRQKFGLNKFSTSISSCPSNPDAINVIAFQTNNLVAINGAETILSVPLSSFFQPVNNASQIDFSLPAKVNDVPTNLTKLDLGGVYTSSISCPCNTGGSTVSAGNFLAIFPTYPSDTIDNDTYLQWTTIKSIEEGELYTGIPVGPTGTSISFNTINTNSIEFSYGANISYVGGTGPMWIGTDGGLLKWDGTDMKLWNNINDQLSSDFVNSIAVNSNSTLWIGTDEGLLFFTEGAETEFTLYNTSSSSIVSNKINDVKRFSDTKIVVATDGGISIFDKTLNTWENFTKFNTPSLTYNDITSIKIDDVSIYMSTTGGVFSYNTSTEIWNSFTSDSVIGWTGSSEVLSLEATSTDLYVGTTGGLIIIPISGATATTITAGASGPVSSVFTSLRINNNTLYAGHDNGISVYNITNETWDYGVTSGDYAPLGYTCTSIISDFNSGLTSGDTIFFGNSQGTYKWLTTGATFSAVPEPNKVTNLLFYYPNSINIESNVGFSSLQTMYFVFSKPMDISSFTSITEITTGLTSVSGTWTWTNNNTVAEFQPSTELSKASLYNISILNGSVALDGSYLKESVNQNFYTEDIEPILGWENMSKILMLSGTNTHPIGGIYLRNPHDFDVTLTTVVGN